MTSKIPQGYHTLTPTLTCKDAAAMIALYKKAFGATEEYCMKTPDGSRVMHAAISVGDSRLFLADESPSTGCLAANPQNGSSVNFYLYVEDPDAWHQKAVAAGMKNILPVQDMFWGDRMGAVADPFGYKWNLAAKVRDVSEKELMEGAKKMMGQAA